MEALLDRVDDQPPAIAFVVQQLMGLGFSSWAYRVVSSAGECLYRTDTMGITVQIYAVCRLWCAYEAETSLHCGINAWGCQRCAPLSRHATMSRIL